MRNTAWVQAAVIAFPLCWAAACKSSSTAKADAAAAASSTPIAVRSASPPAHSNQGPFSPADTAPWLPKLEGPATSDGVKFGLASCFTETKHCIQFPLGWKTDGRAPAMGDGKIAWAFAPNRHACIAVDRGGSDWQELIRRDEAEQKGFSSPVPVKLGVDAIPSTLRATRFDMANARAYPFNILMWFGCFGVEAATSASAADMPAGPATLLVLKIEVKPGLTFNAYAFVSDSATDDEKRDLLATLRGIRSAPGKLATHAK